MNKYVNINTMSDLFKKNENTVALLSKMVSDEKVYKYDTIDSNVLNTRPKDVGDKLSNTEHILNLFPDIEIGIQILATLVLNSQDMATTELIYGSEGKLLPPDIMAKLLNIVRDEITPNYPVFKRLDTILETCLMGKGSDMYVVLAENALDDIINGHGNKLGEIKKKLYDKNGQLLDGGVLQPKYDMSNGLESYDTPIVQNTTGPKHFRANTDTAWSVDNLIGLEITDNLDLLKIPQVIHAANEDRIKKKMRVQMGDFYKPIQGGNHSNVLDVPTMTQASRESIGRPLVLNPNTEAVLPVYTPGTPTEHIGYYIAYNSMGYSVSLKDSLGDENPEDAILEKFKDSTVGDSIRSEAKGNMSKKGKIHDAEAIDFFIKTVERTFVKRVTAGYNIPEATVGDNRSFYLIMLARTLAKRNTKLVFVPYELASYFAVDYDDNGIGVNKLEGMCTLASLRSTLLFSKTLAEVKNNIRSTNVEISLDPDDPNPAKTIELAQSEALKTRQLDLPIGVLAPASLADWLHRAGVSFSYTNHPGLPQMSFNFTDTTLQHQTDQTDENINSIKSAMLNKIGITQDLIDGGMDIDFASTAEAHRLLLLKRATRIRTTFMKHVTHLVKSICLNDKTIQTLLLTTIGGITDLPNMFGIDTENTGSELHIEVMDAFIDAMVVDVASSSTDADIRSLNEKYEAYKDAVDVAIEAWVSEDFISDDVDDPMAIISALKAHFLRDWQQRHGYITDLSDIVTQDSAGAPILKLSKIMTSHYDGLAKTIEGYVKGTGADDTDTVDDDTDTVDDDTDTVDDDTDTVDDDTDTVDDDADTGGDEQYDSTGGDSNDSTDGADDENDEDTPDDDNNDVDDALNKET